MEYILNLSILTLLSYPTATLLDIQSLLTIKDFRNEVLQYVKDMHIRSFWLNEYEKYSPMLRMEAISPILNKMGVFTTHPVLKNIVGQQGSINMQAVVDEGKILLCNFSKGTLGEEVSSLLGSMVLSALEYAVLKRSGTSEIERKPFYTYVDEMHSFVTLAFTSILAEARKYGLSLFLAHQYLEQLDEKVLAAVQQSAQNVHFQRILQLVYWQTKLYFSSSIINFYTSRSSSVYYIATVSFVIITIKKGNCSRT